MNTYEKPRMRIRDLREDRDLSQQKIATVLGITQSTYARYENGSRALPIEAAIKLADYYNCSLDYLFFRSDRK